MKLKPNLISYHKSSYDNITLSERQIEVINRIEEQSAYINLIRSPANVGKTFLACVYFALNTIQNTGVNETSFIVTFDARSFSNNIAPLLTKIYHHLGEKHVKLTDRTVSVTLSNGSTISYISSCSTDPESKTRGCNMSYILIDELSKINSALFFALVSRLRNNPKRKLIATTNADSMVTSGEYNWCYSLFFQNDNYLKMNPKHINVIRLTKDDAYVSKEVMEDYHNLMKSILPDHLISNFIDDSFNMPEDLVYFEATKPSNKTLISEFNINLKDALVNPNTEYYMGVDFGYGHKTGITLAAKSKDKVYILESIGESRLTTSDIYFKITNLMKKYKISNSDIRIAVDPSAPALIEDLSRCGLNVTDAYNKYEAGVTMVNSLFRTGCLKMIQRTNEDLLIEVNSYTHKMRHLKRGDDIVDSMRYLVSTFLHDLYSKVDVSLVQNILDKCLN